MRRFHLLAAAVPIGMMIFGSGNTFSQAFPNKPIRIVSPAAGGGADVVVRLIAQGLASPLGQQVIVDNRPSGIIQGQIVSQAPADGYNLLFAGSTHLLSQFILLDKNPSDPLKVFS